MVEEMLAPVVSPFLRVFTGRFWVGFMLWFLFVLFVLFGAGEYSCIELLFHFFCVFLVVDRQCPVLARQCTKKKSRCCKA